MAITKFAFVNSDFTDRTANTLMKWVCSDGVQESKEELMPFKIRIIFLSSPLKFTVLIKLKNYYLLREQPYFKLTDKRQANDPPSPYGLKNHVKPSGKTKKYRNFKDFC